MFSLLSTTLWQAQTAQVIAGDHAGGNSHHVDARPTLEPPALITAQRLPEKENTSQLEQRKNVSSNVEMEHRGSSEGGMTGQGELRPIQNGPFFGAEAFSSVVGHTRFLSKGPAYPPRQNYPPIDPADQNPPCNTLYVSNLPIDTSEEELKAVFSKQHGYKRLCFRTKQNGPMCFVEFENTSFATKAFHELYGSLWHSSIKGGMRLSFSKNPLGVRSGPAPGLATPEDGLNKLIASAGGRVMMVNDGDMSRNQTKTARYEATDSGYGSLPPQQRLPNTFRVNQETSAPASDFPTSRISATESDIGTVLSAGTTMASDIVQESITHICEDIYHKIQSEICPTRFSAMIGNLGELIKAFAIQLGLDQSHYMGPSIMYFVYKHHSEICALMKERFMDGDENGTESPQGRHGNMSLAEKMEMWQLEFSREHSAIREDAPVKFEGVDDLEDDDPVSNSELSMYSKIILKSPAYRWLVSTLKNQASLCYGDGNSTMAGDEIRQMVFRQLQTGTISKNQPPRTFATCFVLPGYWNTLRSRSHFYGANAQNIRLQNIVVLSVSSDTHAQIATAGQYMRQVWQDSGTLLLQGFQDLVDGRVAECIEVQVHDTAYIKIQIVGSDVNVVCHGPAYFAAQCATQLSWIGCAIQPGRSRPAVHTPCLTQTGAARFLISSRDETTKRHKVLAYVERANKWWQGFDTPACVWGFPTARRPEGFSGVELPLRLANNSLFLPPHLSLGWPVKRLILNKWAAPLCCVGRINSSWLWHLAPTCTCSAKWMENHSGDLNRLTFDDIARDQHILGYCDETSGLLKNKNDETARGQETNSNEGYIEKVTHTPFMKSLNCNSSATHDAQSDSVDTDLLSISSFSCDMDDDALQSDKYATPIIDIVVLQLVSKIACRQAPTLGKPLCDQESTRNAQGTSGISTQDVRRGSANLAPNPGKRKASDQDERDDGEDSSQNRRPEKRMARVGGSSTQQTFACPFWKRDPIKHRTCFHAKLLTSSRVKQHLSRSHTPRFYCQLCFAVFKEEQAQEQHVIQRSCIRMPGMQLDGISPDQQLQLSRKPKLTLTEEERWYRIWDIVLPHDPRPKSPYIDSQLSDCCARFREHWQNLGPELLLREIQSSGVLASAAVDEATTARLLRRILARGLDMIWESWAPPSSSIMQQNLLQQLPATPAYTQEHNSLGPVSSTTSTSSIVDVAPEIHGNLHITPWVGTHHQRVPESPDLSTTGTYTVSQMVFSNPSASEMVQRLEQTIHSPNILDFDDSDILDNNHDFGADIGDIGSWVDL